MSDHVSLSQIAYEHIRRRIVSLDLPPGTTIDETALREELGLGRTPIREALQRLALERLVTIVPRRGTFVTDIGIMDLNRLFEVRMVLESTAARLAAQRGHEDHWRQMERVLRRLDDGADLADNQVLIAIDEACHNLIYDAADNKFLADSLVTLYALSLRLWYYFLPKIGDMQGAISEHRSILESLRMGDAESAGKLMARHIQAFQEEIQSAMLGFPVSEGDR